MNSIIASTREILLLREADFALDGGAMFGIIPRPLWQRTNPPDEQNRIDMSARCVLIRDPDRTILIDVGMGTRWSEREREIYRIDRQDPGMQQALARHNLGPEDIDHVILTHLHFDHVGGLTTADESGALRPTFPNARHWVQRRNWGWAHQPSARDGGSYRSEDFSFLEDADAPPLELVDGIDEILPGIEVIPCHGHTFGMQIVKITCVDATYVFLADLVPTSSHLRGPYVMGYDLQPLATVQEKQEILYHAVRNDWLLLFQHDPTTAIARVEMNEKDQPALIPTGTLPDSLLLEANEPNTSTSDPVE